MKEKCSTVDTIQLYKSFVILEGLQLERLEADKYGDYTDAAIRYYCLDAGIKRECASTSPPHFPPNTIISLSYDNNSRIMVC